MLRIAKRLKFPFLIVAPFITLLFLALGIGLYSVFAYHLSQIFPSLAPTRSLVLGMRIARQALQAQVAELILR